MHTEKAEEKMGNFFSKRKENREAFATDISDNLDLLTENLTHDPTNKPNANENREGVASLNGDVTTIKEIPLKSDVEDEKIDRMTTNVVDSLLEESVAASDNVFSLKHCAVEIVENVELSNANVLKQSDDYERISAVRMEKFISCIESNCLNAGKSTDFGNEESGSRKRPLGKHRDALIESKNIYLTKDDDEESTFLEESTSKNKRRRTHTMSENSNSNELSHLEDMHQSILKKFLRENSCYTYSSLSPVVVLEKISLVQDYPAHLHKYITNNTITMNVNHLIEGSELNRHEKSEMKMLVDAATSEAEDILERCHQHFDNKETISEVENKSDVSSTMSEQEIDDADYFDKDVLTSWLSNHNIVKRPNILRKTKPKIIRGCLVVPIADPDSSELDMSLKSSEFNTEEDQFTEVPLILTAYSLSNAPDVCEKVSEGESAVHKSEEETMLSKSTKEKILPMTTAVDNVEAAERDNTIYPETTKIVDDDDNCAVSHIGKGVLDKQSSLKPALHCSFTSDDDETPSLLESEKKSFVKENSKEKSSQAENENLDGNHVLQGKEKERMLFPCESDNSDNDFVLPNRSKKELSTKNKFKKRKTRSNSSSPKMESAHDCVSISSTDDGNYSLRRLKNKIMKSEQQKEYHLRKKNMEQSEQRNLKKTMMKKSKQRSERHLKKTMLKKSEQRNEQKLKKTIMKKSRKKILKLSDKQNGSNLKKKMIKSEQQNEHKTHSYLNYKECEHKLKPVQIVLEDVMKKKIELRKKEDLLKIYDCPKLLLSPKVVLRKENELLKKMSSSNLRSKRFSSNSITKNKQPISNLAKTRRLLILNQNGNIAPGSSKEDTLILKTRKTRKSIK